MKLETVLSKGTNASVYRDGNIAIKLFNKGFPKTEVLNEALNTSRIEETGLAIPHITDVGLVNNQWAISMNYIQGKTMAQLLIENPDKKEEYIEQMVDLQMTIHEKRSPLLNKLKDKLNRQINSLDCLDDIKKYDLLTRLDGMPKHTKVCHGDFNPHNIIVSKDTLYVLDWVHASQGNASADVARTYLLLAIDDLDTANFYLNLFCKKSNTAKRYVLEWIPIVAAAQLTKNRPEEKELLNKWLDVVEYE